MTSPVGIVGGLAQVARMELGRAQQLSLVARDLVPEAAALVEPKVPEALRSARGAVTLLREQAPSNVHVDVGTQRVLRQIDLLLGDVERGDVPRGDRFALATRFLDAIPGS